MIATEVETEGGATYIIRPGRINNRYEITEPVEVTWGHVAPADGERDGWLYMEHRFHKDDQEWPQIEPLRTFGRDFETIEGKMKQLLASTLELSRVRDHKLAIRPDPVLAVFAARLACIRPLYEVSAPSVNGHH